MICTCGNRFKVDKIGVAVITGGWLKSCDSFKCPNCEKTVLGGIAQVPMAIYPSDEADRIIDGLDAHGIMVYGCGGAK